MSAIFRRTVKPFGKKANYASLSTSLPKAITIGVLLAPNKQFGRNVCRLRNERRLTQEALAEKADISRRYLQQIEAGEMNPTINVAARLRAAFRCTWGELCEKV